MNATLSQTRSDRRALLVKLGKIATALMLSNAAGGCGGGGGGGSTPSPSPTPSPSNRIYGLNFSPYTVKGQDPNLGTTLPADQITSQLNSLKGYTNWIRTFGTQNGMEIVPAYAHQSGFQTAIGAYIGSDAAVNSAQIANLVAAAQAGNVDLAIVGNEVLLNGLQTEDQLIAYIRSVKSQLPGIPVTTVDTWNTIVAHPAIIAEVDVVAANIYPFYENATIDQALSVLQSDYAKTVAAANGKSVIVAETGWPSSGSPPFAGSVAVPSPANAAAYFSSVEAWVRSSNIKLFYFEARDEAWKANHNDYPSWGIWDADGALKQGMNAVFGI